MTRHSASILETERIRPRPFSEDEPVFVLALERDPDNARFSFRSPADEHLAALPEPGWAHRRVAAKQPGRAIGCLILAALQSLHRSIGFVRITIARKGEGYGRECLCASSA